MRLELQHLGFHTPDYTPVARGFNFSYGFLEGGEDHWTHQCGAGKVRCNVPGQPPASTKNWDLWKQSNSNFPGGAQFGMNGTKDDDATYSGYIFTEQAVTAIHAHHNTTPDHPLFMYLGQCFSKRVFS